MDLSDLLDPKVVVVTSERRVNVEPEAEDQQELKENVDLQEKEEVGV